MGEGSLLSGRADWLAVLPALLLAVAAGAAFLWRTLAWEPAVRVDGWAYAAWGQALMSGDRPLFDLGATTPKPLAVVLGALVVPLPPERALAVVAALALGVLVAGLFAVAQREAGAAAAVVAVGAFAVGARLDLVVAFGYIDAVVAALVVIAIALRGRVRVAPLVLAGLLRPEAWILAAVAGFLETKGSVWRRATAALVAGALAPALWILNDVVLMRDPLGTVHWQSQRWQEVTSVDVPWSDVPGDFWAALTGQANIVLVLAGLIGLALHYWKGRRRGPTDSLPLAVAIVWSSVSAIQVHAGGVNPRYLLPLVAVLALGCGLLVAEILPKRLRPGSRWLGTALAAVAVVLATATMGLAPEVSSRIERNKAVAATRPAVEAVLSCGRLGVARRIPARDAIPQLAASTRRPMYDFGIYRGRGRFAAVLHHTRRPRPADGVLPPWPRYETPMGPLAVAPSCNSFG